MPGEGLYAVNWKNPMLLSDAHLRLADRCNAEARRWLARATAPPSGAYGLFPLSRGGSSAIAIEHEHAADRINIHISSLSALAPDGAALGFDEQAHSELRNALTATAELERNPPRPVRLGVLVELFDPGEADSGATIEVGEPDVAEDPPRKPLRSPALRARITSDAASGLGALKVAEYLWDGIAVEPAGDYLPPCLNVAATPELTRTVVGLRKDLRRLRDTLISASAAGAEAPESLLKEAVLPWLCGIAAVEDALPEVGPEIHPYLAWETVVRVLRVSRTMLSARPAALEHAIKTFVQAGKLQSGDVHFFEELDRFLGEPYDHDYLGPAFRRSSELLRGLSEILTYLLGSVPDVREEVVEADVYFYKEKKYRLAPHGARVFQIDEAWHTCFLRDLDVSEPKSLLLVCDNHLLVKNPRPNAGLWMLDKYERVIANMFRVNVDNESDTAKVVALFSEIGEPTVTDVSIASRGLLDLSGLGPEPDGRLRIYFEV